MLSGIGIKKIKRLSNFFMTFIRILEAVYLIGDLLPKVPEALIPSRKPLQKVLEALPQIKPLKKVPKARSRSLKGMGKLSAEERPKMGALVNNVRENVTAVLETKVI